MNTVQNKKVLFIITKSNFGGAQKYIYELAVALKKQGGIPIVAFGGTGKKNSPTGLLKATLTTHNIKTIRIPHLVRDMSPKNDFFSLYELINLIKKEQPDTLHVTSSKAGGLGVLAGRICRSKNIIFTSHGLAYKETWRPWYQRAAITLLTWWTLLLSHKSIMISTDTYNTAKSLPLVTSKITLIHNGVTPQLLVTKNEARKILSPNILSTENSIWIGGIGELHPNKNWIQLIETLPHLPDNVHCVIIGEGQERENLEQKIKTLHLQNRVVLAGFVPDASSLLRAYDIFVLPSLKEGLPYVLLEAGLAKCTVACSNISGNTDIITQNISGLLFTHTQQSILDSLTTLLDNTHLRNTLSNNLYNTVSHEFSIQNMIEQTIRLY